MKKLNVCIVGATGVVGKKIIEVLEEYEFPINNLKLLASKRSVGKSLVYKSNEYIVEELKCDSFKNYDLAFFAAGNMISKEYVDYAIKDGLVVIDNSSYFRQYENVPLVVSEINANHINNKKLIANPNCSTIGAIIPLKLLDDKYGIKRIVYNTYQAVSGSGQNGIDDLESTLKGKDNTFYPYNISKTCIPHIDIFLDNSYTKEEMKMVNETRKILNKNDLLISATCVRVPVINSHAVSVMVELENDFDIENIYELFKDKKGLKVLDDINKNIYPTSIMSNNTDDVYVGRIRKDLSNNKTLLFYTTSDNLRKGAASNAVQIACYMHENNLI